MSWDIVVINSKQKITDASNIDETQLIRHNFGHDLSAHFRHITINDNYWQVNGTTYNLDYFWDGKEVSNFIISVVGEDGLFELVDLAKRHNWQIFDTSIGQMINLDDPSVNGYKNFLQYVRSVMGQQQ